MSKPVLQAKMIGYAPDASGDPIAPNEVVYLCEEPARRRFPVPEWIYMIVYFTVVGLIGTVLQIMFSFLNAVFP